MNKIQLEITEPAYEGLEDRPLRRSFSVEIIKKVIKFLEKYLGSTVLIKIPAELSEIEGVAYEFINTAYKLQKLGVINNIIKIIGYPDEPLMYQYYASSVRKATGWGVDFFSKEKALWKSLGEATERYLWYNSDRFFQNRKICSYRDLKGRALNIFSLAGFSEEQKNKHSILQFDENTVFGWIPARFLVSRKILFCPVQLVSAYYRDKNTEPMLRWGVTTGLSTGQSLKEAIVKGALEVIERDAFMISYLNKLSPPIIDLEYLSDQDEEIAKIIKNFKRYNLEIYILQLPTDFPVYVNLAILIDRTGLGPAVSVGASANFDFKTALLTSLSESLVVRHSLKNIFKKKIDLKKIGREERVVYWAKPENLPKIEFFLKGEKIKIDLSQGFYKTKNNKNNYKEKLRILNTELEKKNYKTCYVELTTKEIKKIGLRCVQVVIPELQPLHLHESIPYFGGKRLKEVPLKFGYQPAKVLNQIPHPFP